MFDNGEFAQDSFHKLTKKKEVRLNSKGRLSGVMLAALALGFMGARLALSCEAYQRWVAVPGPGHWGPYDCDPEDCPKCELGGTMCPGGDAIICSAGGCPPVGPLGCCSMVECEDGTVRPIGKCRSNEGGGGCPNGNTCLIWEEPEVGRWPFCWTL